MTGQKYALKLEVLSAYSILCEIASKFSNLLEKCSIREHSFTLILAKAMPSAFYISEMYNTAQNKASGA